MPIPDELLPLIDQILNRIEQDGAALKSWRQTEDGQKIIQYVVQIGKYNTTVGEGKDISIGDRLDRALLEEVRNLLRSQLSSQVVEINWSQVSRLLLERQVQRLTSNPLTHAEGVTYRTEQVYVPLGLVERKKVSRHREDVPPEQGSLLYKETEISQKFEQAVFLEQVLRQGQSPRSGGRRIVIIGEPGAGKTTLLQQMAWWVTENIEGAIAIWVSLAGLQGRALENYLLEQWLPAVVQQQGQAEASTQVKDALVAQFRAGRVWLWLDGVDEMPVAAGNPLNEVERQVRLGGLLAQARIVLTCRLNLWDGERHALDTFDVYRTLEFTYPKQVEQVVGQWFGALPEAQVGQAERLCEALRQPGKERLRDLVKNPLRLTLLCFNWYLGEGTLPETKAGLYEQFVADFYEWKRERFPTTAEQRRQLNAALGELAREAIDKEETRFRLRHDFVCKFLGEPDEPDSLFQMALRLGWLNQIGVDADNRRKAVYAFFHPTFQEYFAASIIVKQFQENSITFEQLKTDILSKYWQDDSWHEVLLLVCGLVSNKISTKIIDFFIDHFESGKNLIRQNENQSIFQQASLFEPIEDFENKNFDNDFENEDFSVPEYFSRNYNFNSSSLAFAISISQEINNGHNSKMTRQNLIARLEDHLEYLEDFVESLGNYTWDNLTADYLNRIFSDIAILGQGYKEVFNYLASKACDAELQEICSASIRALAEHWNNDEMLLELLVKAAIKNRFGTSKFSINDPNLVTSPRKIALEALFIRYPNHAKTIQALKDRAINDPDEPVRWYAAQALGQLAKSTPEIMDFLFSVVKNSRYDSKYNYRVSPRHTILGAIVLHCSNHFQAFALLSDLALNDSNEELRLWVKEQLKNWESPV
ncbi:hypothetical protein XM38_013150 [Halomicronema hongdechloris C2206]|uniref:NACHT domain-containing protein n=1 Tax=Halomicronema hongdechloris C2206 TaxID=1641165 RepID=A0A1Z3HJW4_9CYAN|nr:NACHT domain-containing protein [Halomicronema hongdechloris]ASC70377.1 hypothetical protein XM38_013150 [Halomicronema hongdechloris C2206]